jgi:endo-alpha-1,4-polygalactosaminidase (GH114 family)
VIRRYALLTTLLSILPLASACGGAGGPASSGGTSSDTSHDSSGGGSSGSSGGGFRGDGTQTPSFAGWAWGNVPADAAAHAGFDWFETGYPGDTGSNDTLRAAGVRPFAYINLGELDDSLKDQANYTGPLLRQNGDWGTWLVDVTDPSWQDWLVRRADYAYQTGSRGVKWDVAQPDVPPGKSRQDVNDAMASIIQRVRSQHPDMKHIFNQGFDFALAYPQLVDAVETEGLFSASSAGSGAWLQPWNDPWWWGPQFDQVKQIHDRGIVILNAEYNDPWSQAAQQLYDAIVAQGFVPYITSEQWNVRGKGLNVNPGW